MVGLLTLNAFWASIWRIFLLILRISRDRGFIALIQLFLFLFLQPGQIDIIPLPQILLILLLLLPEQRIDVALLGTRVE